jgi:sugar/nucleoside kinase (ribokinase family)
MEKLTIKDINAEDLKRSKHLHFSSFFLQPGINNDTVQVFKLAKELGLTTSLDPQWDPAEKWEMDLENLLPYVDVFLPNTTELLNLTKENKVEDAINNIKNYAKTVVVKNGNKGSILFNNGEKTTKEAFLNTNVVDAIGAGDSFDAGFINKFINGSALEECQTFGNLIGAVSTTAAGGTGAFTNYLEIIEIAKETFAYTE